MVHGRRVYPVSGGLFGERRGTDWCMSDNPEAVVVGQLARDLVVVVDEVPDAGTSTTVRHRRETLGGKRAAARICARSEALPNGSREAVRERRSAVRASRPDGWHAGLGK
jgi:hypothetical protein